MVEYALPSNRQKKIRSIITILILTCNTTLSFQTRSKLRHPAYGRINTNSFRPCTFYKGSILKHVREPSQQLQMSIPTPLDTLTSGLSSIVRLPAGTTVRENRDDKTVRLLKLYDVENNPQCRMVRECITELDLVVETVIPSGVNSYVWSNNGDLGKLNLDSSVLPRLVVVETNRINGDDQNGSREYVLQGVDDIISYLEEKFASSISRSSSKTTDEEFVSNVVPEWRSYIASFLRLNRGLSVVTAAKATVEGPFLEKQNAKPIILYSYEGNQFCRLVREVLTELDLPYELRSAGKESPRRSELAALNSDGSTQCPFIVDPNTNVKMNESADIIAYLYKQYADWTPPNPLLQLASSIITPILKPVYAQLAPLQAGKDYDSNEVQTQIKNEILSAPIVIYTYSLSPFCTEAVGILEKLDVPFKEISLGYEWVPFLINEGGAEIRAELGKMFGQTSLPHIFIDGESIGGIFSGTPGLIPALESREVAKKLEQISNYNNNANSMLEMN